MRKRNWFDRSRLGKGVVSAWAAMFLAASTSVWAVDAQADAAAANSDAAIKEIIVTAQYVSQPVQTVPISITAIPSAELQAKGADDLQDYAESVPGLSFADRGPNRDALVIRGISPITGDSAVGLYLDEIPVGNVGYSLPDFRLFDVNRIEILRGPQGTLYGQDSLGGTIRIFTNKPNLENFGAKGEVIGSSTQDGGFNGDANALVNVPLVSGVLGVRLTGLARDDSGWVDNLYNGAKHLNFDHTDGARGAVRYQPTDRLEIQAIVNYQRDHVGLLNEQDPGFGRYRVYRLTDQPENQYNQQFTGIVKYRTNVGTVEEVAGLNNEHDNRGLDSGAYAGIPGYTLLYYNSAQNYSSETRFVSKLRGPLNFVVGAYYQGLERNALLTLVNGGTLFGLPGDYANLAWWKNWEYAIFGQGYYKITDKLTLTVGLRKFWERVDTPGETMIGSIVASRSFGTGNFQSVTPKFDLAYQQTPNLLLYASAGKGYRAGGVNPIPHPGQPDFSPTYKPDWAWSYELGEKSEWFDHRLQVNASIYYIKWSDLQINGIPTDPTLGYTTNAGSAHSQGFELETVTRISKGLDLEFGTGYTEARLDQPAQGAPAGATLPLVPKWGLDAAVQYERPLVAAWTGFTRIDWAYKSSMNEDLPADAIGTIPNYELVNLRFGLKRSKVQLYLFVDNLTNNLGMTSAGGTGQYISRPRTVGVDLRAKL